MTTNTTQAVTTPENMAEIFSLAQEVEIASKKISQAGDDELRRSGEDNITYIVTPTEGELTAKLWQREEGEETYVVVDEKRILAGQKFEAVKWGAATLHGGEEGFEFFNALDHEDEKWVLRVESSQLEHVEIKVFDQGELASQWIGSRAIALSAVNRTEQT